MGCSPWGRKESDTTERLPFHFHALEKEMAIHSSTIAWKIPRTEEPGILQSMGSQRVGLSNFTFTMDCSLPGSYVHGIFLARILEWVALPSCRVSSQPRD